MLESHSEVWQFRRHGEDLPSLPARARPAATSEPARLAAGKPPGLFRQRCHRSGGAERDRILLRAGRTRLPTVSPPDDDQDSGLRLLRGRVLVATATEATTG